MISRDVLEDVIEDWIEVITSENVIHRDITEEIEKTLKYEEIVARRE